MAAKRFWLALGLLGVSPAAIADELETAPTALGDWGGLRRDWAQRGVQLAGCYTGQGTGNLSGGGSTGAAYGGLLNLDIDLDMGALTGWPNASIHTGFLFPHGDSLTDGHVHDLFVLSNLDASATPRVFEVWLEQKAGALSIRLGQLAVDQEFAGTERGVLFTNSAFGWFPIAGNNVTAPVYPQGAPGIWVKVEVDSGAYVQAAVVDGDANPPDADGHPTNPNGISPRLEEGALAIAEVGVIWSTGGGLKLGGWFDTKDWPSLRWDDRGRSLATARSSGVPESNSGNWGVFLVLEQDLVHSESLDLGLFARAGVAPADRNPLESYVEAGLTSTGCLLPGRSQDACGIATALGVMSRDLRGLARDQGDPTALPDFEWIVEADYQVGAWEGLAIQPLFQYILHPGGSTDTANAVVAGIRTSLQI